MTADYDLWVHFDDIERLNAAFEALDHYPTATPEGARARGRYVLENDEHVDVMVARSQSTSEGVTLDFESAWIRRRELTLPTGSIVHIPSLEDRITTKKWGMRAKDIADVQMLEALRRELSNE